MRTIEVRHMLRGLLALATTVVALMALEPAVASATHVFPNSFASCERQDVATGTFDCTLTIVIGSGPFPGGVVVRADEDDISLWLIGATFESAPTRIGGTCAPTTSFFGTTGLDLVLSADLLGGCTIILHETLIAQPPGEVCHSLWAVSANDHPQVVACVPLLPPLTEPTTPGQCKKGGWREFPDFKNQGQCVAFVKRGPKTR
jgi:hypothetical protein